MTACPCCGAPIADHKIVVDLNTNIITDAKTGTSVKVFPRVAEIAAILLGASPALISQERIGTKLYGSDGQFNRNTIAWLVGEFRKSLKGIERAQIINEHGRGYRMVVTP